MPFCSIVNECCPLPLPEFSEWPLCALPLVLLPRTYASVAGRSPFLRVLRILFIIYLVKGLKGHYSHVTSRSSRRRYSPGNWIDSPLAGRAKPLTTISLSKSLYALTVR